MFPGFVLKAVESGESVLQTSIDFSDRERYPSSRKCSQISYDLAPIASSDNQILSSMRLVSSFRPASKRSSLPRLDAPPARRKALEHVHFPEYLDLIPRNVNADITATTVFGNQVRLLRHPEGPLQRRHRAHPPELRVVQRRGAHAAHVLRAVVRELQEANAGARGGRDDAGVEGGGAVVVARRIGAEGNDGESGARPAGRGGGSFGGNPFWFLF